MLARFILYLDRHRFYTYTFCGLVVWLTFIDNNDLRGLIRLRKKKSEQKKELQYYKEQIKIVNEEYSEVLGTSSQLEKFAREKYFMQRPNEDVYVIVDENNQVVPK